MCDSYFVVSYIGIKSLQNIVFLNEGGYRPFSTFKKKLLIYLAGWIVRFLIFMFLFQLLYAFYHSQFIEAYSFAFSPLSV